MHKLSKKLEVTVHTDFEEHQMSKCDACPGSDGQLTDKPDEFSVDSGVEGHEEKIRRESVIDVGSSVNS